MSIETSFLNFLALIRPVCPPRRNASPLSAAKIACESYIWKDGELFSHATRKWTFTMGEENEISRRSLGAKLKIPLDQRLKLAQEGVHKFANPLHDYASMGTPTCALR